MTDDLAIVADTLPAVAAALRRMVLAGDRHYAARQLPGGLHVALTRTVDRDLPDVFHYRVDVTRYHDLPTVAEVQAIGAACGAPPGVEWLWRRDPRPQPVLCAAWCRWAEGPAALVAGRGGVVTQRAAAQDGRP